MNRSLIIEYDGEWNEKPNPPIDAEFFNDLVEIFQKYGWEIKGLIGMPSEELWEKMAPKKPQPLGDTLGWFGPIPVIPEVDEELKVREPTTLSTRELTSKLLEDHEPLLAKILRL
jgi:hypothetical protein